VNVPDLDGCLTPKKIINCEKKIVCETPSLEARPSESGESRAVTGTVRVSDDDEVEGSLENFSVDKAEMGSTLE
jgi:hypothetical protein